MTDRERLIELMYSANSKFSKENITDEEAVEILADHLIENGVIVLPCKVGDVVYWVDLIEGVITTFEGKEVNLAFIERNSTRFGKDIFLTREEAEQELKKRKKERKKNG